MSVQNFKPTVWSARLLAKLNESLVFGNIVNRNYEGEITGFGDSVKINQIGSVTVGDYDKENGINIQQVDGTQQTLAIDQQKYFAFEVHDVDAVQANIALMEEYMVESSVEMARVLDKYIASLYVHAANTIGSDTTPESIADVSEAYDYLIDLLTKLDESDVPEAGRFIVLPPKVAAMVAKDRSLFAPAPEGLANAVGAIEDVTIFKSNNIPTDETVQRVIAGYKGAITFANQFVEVEALRSASHFSDIVRGLNVFGAKVVRPEGLAVLTLEK